MKKNHDSMMHEKNHEFLIIQKFMKKIMHDFFHVQEFFSCA